ncbi:MULTISPECIES: PAS domain-containing protein [unclassified Streptomyces]|uniref:PAS domain-containing protein n=1 Tax=unclassified Streptomyces TaxID=2593676 RepID=UPI00386BA05B
MLPYDFMLAAAPITNGAAPSGGLVLLWPIFRTPDLSPAEREAIDAFGDTAWRVLQQAADHGYPALPVDTPRLLSPPPSRVPEPDEALAGVGFAERLPVGCCAMDLDGRITFINSAAADLVGAGIALLRGARPWEVLMSMREPVFEDHYRQAVVSRQPASFTALRPTGHVAIVPALPRRFRYQRPHHPGRRPCGGTRTTIRCPLQSWPAWRLCTI